MTVRMFLLLLTIVAASSAQTAGSSPRPSVDMPKSIIGKVRLPSGERAPQGLLVILEENSGMEVGRMMTDSSGRFEFRVGSSDRYWVTVSAPGYKIEKTPVDAEFGPSGYVDITLKPDPNARPTNGPASGTVPANAPASEKAKKELAEGEQLLFEKKDPKASIPHFEKVTREEPKYAPAFVLLATASLQSADWDGAAKAAETATKLDAKNPAAQLVYGMALSQKDRFKDAVAPLKRSIELSPDSFQAHLELAKAYWGAGDVVNTESPARKAAQLQPMAGLPHVLLGNVLLRQRNAPGALAEFKTAVELEPQADFAPSAREMVSKLQTALDQAKQGTAPK